MKANRTKMLGTIALVAVLCMQLFWIYNSFQMSVHQMGYDNPWSLAADVRAHAFFFGTLPESHHPAHFSTHHGGHHSEPYRPNQLYR